MNSNDVSSLQKPRPSLGKSLLLAVGFGLLGYLGNLVRLPLGFNLSFIFGSIFTLACTVLLGWRWGLVSTLLASVYTFFLWNHPYAIVILGAETLWVACALRRGHRNLLQIPRRNFHRSHRPRSCHRIRSHDRYHRSCRLHGPLRNSRYPHHFSHQQPQSGEYQM